MTIIVNRQFQHDVEVVAGNHQDITFSVASDSAGELVFTFAGDKQLYTRLRAGRLIITTTKTMGDKEADDEKD